MIRSLKAAGLVSLLSVAAGSAFASPVINGSILNTRVFNDFPGSSLVTVNSYPGTISFNDTNLVGTAFANRHNFRLSDSAGAAEAVFLNGDTFTVSSSVRIDGPGRAEAGLNVSPWWSQEVDGVFMINGDNGEIACFGGRLPFYSFTGNFGLTYTVGTTIRQTVEYAANGLNAVEPANIRYTYTDGSGTYQSPWLAFDQGNPGEDPPYGLWGMLNDARVGGYAQIRGSATGPQGNTVTFGDITYSPSVPEPTTLSLLVLGGLLSLRRR